MKEDRVFAIRELLFSGGAHLVQDIAKAIGASVATVRRDLIELEAQGLIVRTHGGARIAETAGVEVAFALRERRQLGAKRAIAEAAYRRLHAHETIFLDAGTTVLQLARILRQHPLPMSVFTNCLPVAQVLMGMDEVRVSLLGGALRTENASTVGGLAEKLLDDLWFDQLFLGAGALAPDCCIYSLDEAEAHLNAKMIARSARRTLLIDATKFGLRQTYRVAVLDRGIDVITDPTLGGDWRAQLENRGVVVTLSDAPSEALSDAAGDRE